MIPQTTNTILTATIFNQSILQYYIHGPSQTTPRGFSFILKALVSPINLTRSSNLYKISQFVLSPNSPRVIIWRFFCLIYKRRGRYFGTTSSTMRHECNVAFYFWPLFQSDSHYIFILHIYEVSIKPDLYF